MYEALCSTFNTHLYIKLNAGSFSLDTSGNIIIQINNRKKAGFKSWELWVSSLRRAMLNYVLASFGGNLTL